MIKRLILAAGHGGGDSGAVGQGTTEAAEAIQIVNRLADKLRADGQVEVVVVPHELNLAPSINWVNDHFKDTNDGICVEVHKNATNNAHGIEVWYYGGDSGSLAYAQKVLSGIMSVPGMPVSRGCKPDTSNRWGTLGWIRETNPVALLVEMGFVSDGGDPVDDNADDGYAQGLFVGLLKALDLTPRPKPQPVPLPESPETEIVQPKYRVYSNTKQIGAYNTAEAAWNKYSDPAVGAVKIVLVAQDKDVTSDFVAKYRPQPTQPAPGTEPHPVYDPAKDTVQDKAIADQAKRLDALEQAMTGLKAVVDMIVNWFKSFGK